MGDSPLFAVLDKAGVRYTPRITEGGVPYAGFFWSLNGEHAGTSVTALLENNVLRLTAHDIAHESQASADLSLVLAMGVDLPLGAAYRSPSDGTIELSVGLYVGDSALQPEQLSRLLDYLDSARAYLETNRSYLPRPQLHPASNRDGQDIGPVLARYAHRTQPLERGTAIELTLAQGLKCRVEIRETPDGWFAAKARYVPEPLIAKCDVDIALFQRLQYWARAGRFTLGDAGELRAEVFTPQLGQPVDELIRWTVSQATALLDVAAKHYGFSAEGVA